MDIIEEQISFIKECQKTYQKITWKSFSNRDKDVANSVFSSIIVDLIHKKETNIEAKETV
jgi:hypothetical protein